MSIVVLDESTPAVRDEKQRFNRIARPMSIAAVDEETPSAPVPKADESMRLPKFDESCPHVRDQIIPMNGGRFNVDQYLRVLRAKAEVDASIAMALTAAGHRKAPLQTPVRHFTLLG